MPKTVGSLTLHTARNALGAQDELLDVSPVVISTLLARRRAWGNVSYRYDDSNRFFKDHSWAKLASEKLRKRGTDFVVYDLPALRLDGTDCSLVMVNVEAWDPFSGPTESLAELRAGVRVGAAVEMLGGLDAASPVATGGVVVLDVGRGIPLASVEADSYRTWESWSGPRLSWTQPAEPHFSSSGVQKVAALLSRQSGKAAIVAARRRLSELGVSQPNQRPNLQVVR